ncbi:MAG: L-threonylcarbamoyladenylate synthase [Paracoccaceae bacterium]
MALKTALLKDSPEGIAKAAAVLASGGLCAIPTETVYGLGADARNDQAVARIFEAKARPHFNPLIVHLPSLEAAEQFAVFNDAARALANAFWPGPLTLVLPLREGSGLSPLVTAGLESVAIRMPAHPLAVSVLRAFGGPVAAPSANPSGKISPTRAEHVLGGLSGRIEAILDGGACGVGVESTIIGLTGAPVLLRPGGLPAEAIEACLAAPLAAQDAHAAINAPGQLASHYAPDALMRLNADAAQSGEVLLGFGAVEDAAINLSPSGDLVEAAAALFHALRELDAQGVRKIAVSPIPMHGLGAAINDRLSRAAAERP